MTGFCAVSTLKTLERRYENVGATQDNFKSHIEATFIIEDAFQTGSAKERYSSQDHYKIKP